jgi:hypothetical protein
MMVDEGLTNADTVDEVSATTTVAAMVDTNLMVKVLKWDFSS